MLSINNIEVVYDNVILVLKGVSLEVKPGAITTLLGANGAGKTTTLKAVSGVLRTERGEVTKGSIALEGKRVDGMRAFDVTKLGISQVFEGRRVFEHLTTEENLIAGAHTQRQAGKVSEGIERVYAYFPILKNRRAQLSGYLSGGEQQMLAIGRALMSSPKVMLLDEPSLGLAPMLVEEIFAIVRRLVQQEKLSVLLVEQNAVMALEVADHGYVMENGRIVLEGSVATLRSNSDIREFYLGLNEVGSRKSYRDVKHYKPRKRWLSGTGSRTRQRSLFSQRRQRAGAGRDQAGALARRLLEEQKALPEDEGVEQNRPRLGILFAKAHLAIEVLDVLQARRIHLRHG